jgi:hypothetical protein
MAADQPGVGSVAIMFVKIKIWKLAAEMASHG